MSIRPTLLRSLNARRAIGVRGISSTGPKRAGHQDSHAEDDSTHTHESFLSPPWRNTLILLTASILIYPYLPSPSKQSLSPSLSPEAHASTSTSNSETPLVTRLLAKYTPDAKITNERNDKHLELSAEKAGERLLFQEAERPRVHRMRFPSHFEQASPHCLPVGGSVDLSDLQVKRE